MIADLFMSEKDAKPEIDACTQECDACDTVSVAPVVEAVAVEHNGDGNIFAMVEFH